MSSITFKTCPICNAILVPERIFCPACRWSFTESGFTTHYDQLIWERQNGWVPPDPDAPGTNKKAPTIDQKKARAIWLFGKKNRGSKRV